MAPTPGIQPKSDLQVVVFIALDRISMVNQYLKRATITTSVSLVARSSIVTIVIFTGLSLHYNFSLQIR